VLPLARAAIVIELLTLPSRRGPPLEAQSCYRVLDERAANPIAAVKASSPEGITPP
jgi:ribosome-associated heat shock protein Hsp15